MYLKVFHFPLFYDTLTVALAIAACERGIQVLCADYIEGGFFYA